MKIKFENIKLSISQTKNPLFFQLGVHVNKQTADANGLSHEGMGFTLVSKDELKALVGLGFKPFSLTTFEGEFREDDNIDPTKPKLIKFDFADQPKFTGGIGTWDEFLTAPAPAKKEEEKPAPKGF